MKVEYSKLTNLYEAVNDNAGMMLMKFLSEMPIAKVFLAGMDGYSVDIEQNYSDEKYMLNSEKKMLEKMNAGMNFLLREYASKMGIAFLTTPRFINI